MSIRDSLGTVVLRPVKYSFSNSRGTASVPGTEEQGGAVVQEELLRCQGDLGDNPPGGQLSVSVLTSRAPRIAIADIEAYPKCFSGAQIEACGGALEQFVQHEPRGCMLKLDAGPVGASWST